MFKVFCCLFTWWCTSNTEMSYWDIMNTIKVACPLIFLDINPSFWCCLSVCFLVFMTCFKFPNVLWNPKVFFTYILLFVWQYLLISLEGFLDVKYFRKYTAPQMHFELHKKTFLNTFERYGRLIFGFKLRKGTTGTK